MRHPLAPVLVRDSVAEVETQRDDLLAYLSAARSILDVCASAHGASATAQEVALALVRELGVEACALTLREERDGGLLLAGFAAQSDRFGPPRPGLTESAWVTLAGLASASMAPACFRRDPDGGFAVVAPSDLATEGFTTLPFAVGDERRGVLLLHTVVAPGQLFARIQGYGLLADMVGHALTVARTRDATERLCDKLSRELGVSRRELVRREQTLRAREDSMARLTHELVRSNAAKSEFLATVSHELRTPLNAILGYSELLHDGHIGTLEGEQIEAIARVLAAAHNLHLRVDDILFFVQMESGQVPVRTEVVAVEQILAEVLAALPNRPAPDVVAVEIEIDPRARTLQADGALVRRMLFHLLANAFKFTEQGSIGVEIKAADRGEDALLVVRDSGVGIAPERLGAIFDAFVQADGSDARRFDGLGMGLALVHRAAHLLGGRVTVESVPGRGSEFTVTLPGSLAAVAGAMPRLADQQPTR